MTRIESNKKLQEVVTRLENRRDTAESVLLSDIEEEQATIGAAGGDKNLEGENDNGKDGALTAQADEALSILADLVDLQR